MFGEALRLEDPNGSVLLLTRIDNAAFTVSYQPGNDGEPYRGFEADRAKICEFLAGPLDG